ncbi:MAG: hypothetical protein LBU07_00085, partial [Coriobacteriales bacterium]|nr:hypothetical protein [Coriobacteriales bacterium]
MSTPTAARSQRDPQRDDRRRKDARVGGAGISVLRAAPQKIARRAIRHVASLTPPACARILRAALALVLAMSLVPAAALAADMNTEAAGAPAASPQFSHHPDDATYSEEANVLFYVRAASIDSGYLTYQWHRSPAYSTPVANVTTDPAAQASIKATDVAFDPTTNTTSSVLSDTTPAVDDTTYFYYWVTVTNHKDANGDGDTDDFGEDASLDSRLAQVKVVDRTL